MKMLKIMLNTAIALALTACCATSVFADDNMEAAFDRESGQITVSGSAETGQRITLKVFSKSDYTNNDISMVDDEDIAYFYHTDTNPDGSFVFNFKIDSSRKNGLYVAAASDGNLFNAECEFILIDTKLVADMLDKLNKTDEAGVNTLIQEGIFTVFGTDETEVAYFESLDGEYKRTVILSWIAGRLTEGYADYKSANGGFYSACGYAELKASEPTDENRAEIEAGIKKILEGLGAQKLWEKYEGTNSANALSTSVKEKTYSDAVLTLANADTSVQFADELIDKMALNSINEATSWMGYKDIIDNTTANNGFSKYIEGIDTTTLNRNKTEALKLAYSTRPVEYASLAAFVSHINSAAVNAAGSIPSGGGGGGGGGVSNSPSRGGSIGSVTAPIIAPDTNTQAPVQLIGGFRDMAGYEWAEAAVKLLSDKGIINGVGEQKFAPYENITREQFVKMLVLTFEIPVDENVTADFEDCSYGDWSYPYIAAAQSRGFVKGTGTRFGRTDFITRQDAAVMTYRFMGLDAADSENVDFTDYAEISDYALEAVSAMVNAGVVKGIGDGRFDPKSNMTRVQSAQMLYNVLNME